MSFGFTYNGQYSVDKGLIVTNVQRDILPPALSRTLPVPKRPGAYYVRTDYDVRPIKVDITYNGSSIQDVRTAVRGLASWLKPGTVKALIFDDEPDKTYYAVLDGTTDLSQIYRLAQGTLTFLCPDPFAYGAAHSRGIDGPTGTFSRNSVANDPNTLASVALGVPRFAPGKFGNGVFVEAGTTNLVFNSDFEEVTTTIKAFHDAVTSYTGSTVPAPWTLHSGSFTFGTSGAICGGALSELTAGNPAWKPLLGSDGTTKLPLTAQATFTTPAAIPSGTNLCRLELWKDGSNRYFVNWNETTNQLFLDKLVGGTVTVLQSAAATPSASMNYTITLSLDHAGLLTAKLYQGPDTTGTLLQSFTATDVSLSNGFLLGVGGDAGVVVSNAIVTAPWANNWGNLNKDTGCVPAYALTTSLNGSYAAAIYAPSTTGSFMAVNSETTNSYPVSASTTYTASAYVDTTGLTSGSAILRLIEWSNTGAIVKDDGIVASKSASSGYSRIIGSITTQPTTAYVSVRPQLSGAGTAVFDAVQLEQKAYATSYLRNDAIATPATRNPETLDYPASLLSAAQGSISLWVTPNLVNPPTSDELVALSAFQTTNANGKYWLGWNGHGWGCADLNLIASTGNVPYAVGTPVHLCAAWAGSTMSVYVNGVKLGSGNLLSGFAISDAIRVGHFVGGVLQIGGSVDELCIFDRTLSDAEVTSLYQATSAAPPVTDGLTALYPFDSDVANSPQPVDVQGTAETLPVVTANFTSPSTNYKVTHVETGDLVNILHDFVAGDQLVIDCTKNSVTINGANALTDLDIASDFFQLASGSNTFTVQSPGDAVTELSYTERWL